MFNFKTFTTKTLADSHTPVQLYYQLRDLYPNALLLECSDHKFKENSFSYLCLNPIATFVADHKNVKKIFPNEEILIEKTRDVDVIQSINCFIDSFYSDLSEIKPFIQCGFFGYTSYDAIPLVENIQFKSIPVDIPLIKYQFFKILIVFDHFHNNLYVCEQLSDDEKSSYDTILKQISNKTIIPFGFQTIENEKSNFTDTVFLEKIKSGQKHCFLGDVFQLVLSRKFRQKFTGDDFNVYRSLRSINPSPYLFYFDYGDYKLFGSSPETQLIVNERIAQINPIAGTFKRTGDSNEDNEISNKLLLDSKESSEHVMLVDLARNDLSKNCTNVYVKSFKKVEFYSHVIHLVSKVVGKLKNEFNSFSVLTSSYPAGTLSGAPKKRAMQLIDQLEPDSRGLYGGTIGFIGLDKNINHAIFIRSFFSKNHELVYQAGCGIVSKSVPELELEEVNNKISVLRQAILNAETI